MLLASVNAGTAKAAAEGTPVKVGSALPLSGPASLDGINYRHGLELAAKDINEVGGILGRPIEMVFEDTAQMGSAMTSQAMRRLVDRESVCAIVNGYNTSTSMVEMDIAAEADIIFTHMNTQQLHNDKFNEDPAKYYSCFQMCPPNYYYGPGILLFMKSVVDNKSWTPPNMKMAVITSSSQYAILIANAVRDGATASGFEVVVSETVPFPNNQWGPVLAKIRQEKPAFIVVSHNMPQDLAMFMQQFATDPTDSLIYMQYGPSLPAFREIGKEAVNGVIYSTVNGCLPDEFSEGFRTRYKAAYGDNAAYTSGSQTYESLWQYALAAAIAGGPGEAYDKAQTTKVADAFRRLIYRGVNGSVRIDPKGQSAYCFPAQTNDPSLGLPLQFYQHKDYREAPKLISPVLYAQAEFSVPSWIKS